MLKGRLPKLNKLKGSICNILIDLPDIANVLLRGANSNGLVILKIELFWTCLF